MVRPRMRLLAEREATSVRLLPRFGQIRSDLKVPQEFSPEVLAAAQQAAQSPDLPAADRRDIPFVTVDPPGSTDLDQALYLATRPDGGYDAFYAIADVPAFVRPGSPVDVEARRRGQTIYAPDTRVPLHPPVLSEGVASLLPDQDRPAFVWSFRLDASGQVQSSGVTRAMVRSRLRLNYDQIQQAADAHPGDDLPTGLSQTQALLVTQAVLMREIGSRREKLELARGGASLPLPEQEVHEGDGRFALSVRPQSPSEGWNAQLSLMTGMAAAQLMLTARVGLLRTMPPPGANALNGFRRRAQALGVTWPDGLTYGAFLRTLDPDVPAELALMYEAASLFRGAGYTPLAVANPLPQNTLHAAVAAPYAHVTAPLRRLVDRFGLVTCAALAAGDEVPDWVIEALPTLPEVMRTSDDLASQVDRRSTDVVEAAVLAPRVGETFNAIVIDHTRTGVKVQLADPPVLTQLSASADVGTTLAVRVESVDVERGRVNLAPADPVR